MRVHWLRSLIAGIARRQFDFYKDLDRTENRLFPDTTDEESALRWGNIYVGPPIPASTASGNAVATGTAGSSIGVGIVLSSDGNEYITTAGATIQNQTISVTSITRSGTTATATTASPHGLAPNIPVTIAGANETEYNVIGADIIVTGDDEFQFQVAGSPTTPATGTITASFTSASMPIESTDFGSTVNLDAGSPLQLQSPIAGVDDTLNADFGAIGGGTDEESVSDYVSRYLDKIRNPVAHFNVSAITAKAKEVPGVTRVFVEEITPAVGQVTIYFMRDNDVDPIPSGSEVATVKSAILEIKPANTSDVDVIVSAPTAVPVDYTFTALSPSTSTMKAAIEANLAQFHDEQTFIGVNVDEDAYRSAIKNTVDPDTGDTVISFTLSAPAGDVAIASGEIATLGTVTFP
ncbi:MAG: baseplate J/gp47 family protein [Candidatus Aminicenantes bacterium]|nr:baseplate J/gp47 family protein [Candidatus Aminicenantes bacterium]